MKIAARLSRIEASPSSMGRQRARELREAGRDLLSLTTGEPDMDTPPHVIDAALRAMKAGQTKYTDPGGTPELKHAVCRKLRRENGLDYTIGETIISSGAKQVVFNALVATLEEGDEIVVPAPYWVSYPDVAKLVGAKPVIVQCPPEKGFKLQPEDLERAITPRTRWLVLNAPNNPSGAMLLRDELKAITDVLMRHPHVALMTDDIYEHIRYDGREFVNALNVEPRLRDRTLIVNGVSKTYAMTGWRVGYGAGPVPLMKAMLKVQSQSTNHPSSIGQAAAIAALDGPQDGVKHNCAVFGSRRDLVVKAFNATPGIACHNPEGAFYAFASCKGLLGKRTPEGRTIETALDFEVYLLDHANVAVLGGESYGVPGFFRVSFASSMEVLEECCSRIKRACGELR